MRMISTKLILGAAAGLAFSALAGTAIAETNSVQSQCSDMYKADKAANKLPTGQTWPQYYSACAAKLKASADTKTADTKTAPAATADAGSGETVMQQCSAQYKDDKAAKKVPAGQTWPQYYSACAARVKAASADDVANPPEPSKTSANAAPATKDASGKPFTPGQLAAHARIKECGQMWQADKAAGKTKGQTWPKYWSACNTKLKAAGK